MCSNCIEHIAECSWSLPLLVLHLHLLLHPVPHKRPLQHRLLACLKHTCRSALITKSTDQRELQNVKTGEQNAAADYKESVSVRDYRRGRQDLVPL